MRANVRLIFAAALTVTAAGCKPLTEPPTLTVTQLLPPTQLGGAAFDAAQVVGKPVVITYFRPTCGHCQVEMPRVAAAAAERGITAVAVMVAGNSDAGELMAVRAGFAGYALDDTAVETGSVKQALNLRAVPLTLFVGSDGRVSRALRGEQHPDDLRAALALLQ